MARTRIVKPDFFANEEMPRLTMPARLLFVALWTMADRRGRLEDRPLKIRRESFPYEDVNVVPLLDELAMIGFILRYQVDGEKFIMVRNFEKHQHPHKNEQESEFPAPPPELLSRNSMSTPAIAGSTPEMAPCPDPVSDPVSDRDERIGTPARSVEPKTGTVHWLRSLYRGPWEAKYSGAFFGANKGDQTAWENHLAANPDPGYRAQLFGDAKRLLLAYLADADPQLCERRHPLAFFPERIPKYRASPPPHHRAPAFDRAKISAQR